MSDEAASGNTAKKKTFGRPFTKGADGRRRQEQEREVAAMAETDFATFSASLLKDPQVRAAMVRRWKRGLASAQELRLISDAAQSAQPTTDKQQELDQAREEVKRLSRPETTLLYALLRKMAGRATDVTAGGYAWQLVRTPGSRAGTGVPNYVPQAPQPRVEPELSPGSPLADASRRLKQLPPAATRRLVEVGPRTELSTAIEIIVTEGGDHACDWRDAAHRSTCRAARQRFLSEP